jgi:hypothetical protein
MVTGRLYKLPEFLEAFLHPVFEYYKHIAMVTAHDLYLIAQAGQGLKEGALAQFFLFTAYLDAFDIDQRLTKSCSDIVHALEELPLAAGQFL